MSDISTNIDEDFAVAREKYKRDTGKELSVIRYMDDSGIDIAYSDRAESYIFKGDRARSIIENAATIEEFTSGKMGTDRVLRNTGRRVFAPGVENPELLERLKQSALDKIKIDEFSDEELAKMIKQRKTNVNAMMNDIGSRIKDEYQTTKRVLLNLGERGQELASRMEEFKVNFASMKKADLVKALEQGGKKFQMLIDGKFKSGMSEELGSLLAVKTFTGEIYNVAKYTLGDIAMTLYGTKDSEKAKRIMDWAGELSQINISAKKKIPVVTGDVISSLRTVLDPNARAFEVAEAMKKFKNGEFNIISSRVEVEDMFNTDAFLRNNTAKIHNQQAMGAVKKIRNIIQDINDRSSPMHPEITNKHFLEFAKAKVELANDAFLKDKLNLDYDEVERLRASIAGNEKGVQKLTSLGFNVGEMRDEIYERMRVHGVNSLNELRYAQTFIQNISAESHKTYKDIAKIGRSSLALENTIGEIIAPGAIRNAVKNATGPIFGNESIMSSLSNRITNKLGRRIENSRLSDYVDTTSFRNVGLGSLLGMAAIGFIGMFAIQSNRRDWLGPTAGTGGEYSERRRRKNEEHSQNIDVHRRLRERDILTGPLHFAKDNNARLMPRGIKKKHAPEVRDRLAAIANMNMMDTMELHNFNQ